MRAYNKNINNNRPQTTTVATLLALAILLFTETVSAQKNPGKNQIDTSQKKAVDSLYLEPVDSLQLEYDQDSAKIVHDSAAGMLFDYMKESGLEIEKRNIAEYRDDTIATKHDAIIEEIKRLTLEAE